MGTVTSKFALYKPAPSEDVDVNLHLNANWDKIDAAVNQSGLNSVENSLQNQINDLKKSVYGDVNYAKAPACKISKGGTQNLPNGSTTIVNFGTVDWETKASMSDLSHNRLVVPVAGIYLFLFQWTLDPVFNGEHRGIIFSGADASAANRRSASKHPGQGATPGGGFAHGNISFLGNATAGTEIGAAVWHNGGSGIQVSDVETGTFLACVRVSDKAN